MVDIRKTAESDGLVGRRTVTALHATYAQKMLRVVDMAQTCRFMT